MIRNFRLLYPDVSLRPKETLFLIVGMTTVEFIIFACTIRRIVITTNVLRRSKQIGFRFFLMQNFIAYSLFIVADGAIVIFLPRDYALTFQIRAPLYPSIL